ncbi:MAG: TatD family hydrolase [Nonlabens sp.]
MRFIDTHTHLYSDRFEKDSASVIQRALDQGITDFCLPAIDSTYTSSMFALKAAYPDKMHIMAGLHPTSVKDDFEQELQHVRFNLVHNDPIAIGEIGVDLYWDRTFVKEQMTAFEEQVSLAIKNELPFVIHCRQAFDEVFEVLQLFKGKKLTGIFHCFTGTMDHAQKAIDLNLKLGIGGVITFKNGQIDQFIHQIPLSSIVLETDAPYLAPVPYRGKRNESSYLVWVAQKLADLYHLPIEQIAAATTFNALEVFTKLR